MMELQVGVKVMIRNSDGRYLILRRAPYEPFATKQKWDFPGGRIELGSTLLDNLARELREETGLSLEGEPQLLAAQDVFVPQDNRHVIRLTYIGEGEGVVVLSKEHTEYRWVSAAELRLLEPLDRYLKQLVDRGLFGE